MGPNWGTNSRPEYPRVASFATFRVAAPQGRLVALPLKSLLAFETVARNGSFSKAARELNVTQSAISHQIKNLEEYFGVLLLDRSGPAIVMTAEGRVLYDDLSQAMALVRRSVSGLKGKIARAPVGIWVRPHFAMKWLSGRLKDANFQFDCRFYHTNEPADFADPAIHVAIEWLRRRRAPDDAKLLLSGNLTPACHPALLEGIDNPTNPAILEQFALLHEYDAGSWRDWLTLAGVPELSARRNEYYTDTNVRQQAAMERLGFALVCPALVTDDIAAGRLVLPFETRLNSHGYYLIVPENRLSIANVRRFVSWLIREI
jgi:LysR family glycine cleavage system transcriptional activator